VETNDSGDMATMTVGTVATRTVQSISVFIGGSEIKAYVDYSELSQEGDNRVNIYGKSTSGLWTDYNQA
jgi:hypothetical protein